MIYWKDFNYSSLDLEDYTVKTVQNPVTGDKEDIKYSNIIFTFDCEVTSFFITPENEIVMFDYKKEQDYYIDCKKGGLVYIWMVGINDEVVYGRDIAEYKEFETKLSRMFRIRNNLNRIYYIHNLSYDFQLIQNALGVDWDIFTRKKRKVMKAECLFPWGIEYRCSYLLTNRSLENCCKDYRLPVEKKVGDLDYNVMRTPLTPLTEKEMDYCEYDIKAVYYLIEAHKKEFKGLLKIPMTSTGKIRRKVKQIFYNDKKYKQKVTGMMPTTFTEFNLLCKVYQGGYTHASIEHSNKVLKHVYSYDIGSSYPYEMVTKKFPMTPFTQSLDTDLSKIDFDNYAVIVDIEFFDIVAKYPMTFLSDSKMVEYDRFIEGYDDYVYDNGRLLKAKRCRYILTDEDLKTVIESYNIKGGYIIHSLYTAKKDYLDSRFIQFILDLYKDKTTLKGIEEKISEYFTSKEYVNGSYGMMVMKIIVDEILYNRGKWSNGNEDEDGKYDEKKALQAAIEKLDKIHTDKEEILNFAWGVWVSAYARRHLWKMILKDPWAVVYVDTDSIKSIRDFSKYMEEDKQEVLNAIKEVCMVRNLNPGDYMPLTSKGEMKIIGLFEEEAVYKEFKTIGAKKYAYTYYEDKKWGEGVLKAGKVGITVSGINKNTGIKYFEGKTIEDFKIGAFFDYEYAGKSMIHYIDDQEEIVMPDGYVVKQRYSICIQPTTYTLGITKDYYDLVNSWSAGSKLLD